MQESKSTHSPLINLFNRALGNLDLAQRIDWIGMAAEHAVFTTSLGLEDQVLTWAIAKSGHDIEVATLDTGRLFDQTHELIKVTEQRYNIEIKRYHPNPKAVADYVATYGRDGFYNSVEARHACCNIRKLVPLAEALKGADIWITGLRRGQSSARGEIPFAEWSPDGRTIKVNPLADWTSDDIDLAVDDHDIPVNPLHQQGYPSIGCAPCTRAIQPGEDPRAGRWWWELDKRRECGLHVAEEHSSEAAVPGERI